MEGGFLKVVALVILGIISVMIVINVMRGILALLMPIAILGGVGYIIYRLAQPKSISGGRNGFLP